VEFYLNINGEKVGPCRIEDIHEKLDASKITLDDEVWVEGNTDKVTVREALNIHRRNVGHAVREDLVAPFEAYKGSEPFIFVSYAHRDAVMVYTEISQLKEKGYNIWYDEGIEASNEWPEEIANAVIACTVFLVFVSPNSTASVNCRNEINLALDEGKSFLAIHIEESTLPPGLRLRMGDLQAIMRFKMNREQYEKKLTAGLNPMLEGRGKEQLSDFHQTRNTNNSVRCLEKNGNRTGSNRSANSGRRRFGRGQSFAFVCTLFFGLLFVIYKFALESERGVSDELAETTNPSEMSNDISSQPIKSPNENLEPDLKQSLVNGLMLHYEFDEKNGAVVKDSSIYDRDGRLYGLDEKQKTWVPGKIGGAIKLDGKNDYIQAPVTLDLEFTVTFWLKTETSMGDMNTSDWNSPVGLFTGTPFTHAAFLAKGKLMFWSSNWGYRKASSIFVNDGSWFHVACSRSDQNHMKKGHFHLYLNGNMDSRQTFAYTRCKTGSTIYLGRNYSGTKYYDGLFDELRVYDRQIEDEEVKAIYGLGLAPSPKLNPRD
jgi:hypothetical protein